MHEAVYILCALMSGFCAFMLMRGYLRYRQRLMFWSTLCFAFLVVSNILLVVDLAIYPEFPDLSVVRTIPTVIGIGLMLFGLIWEEPR
jgi:hypothetical protein